MLREHAWDIDKRRLNMTATNVRGLGQSRLMLIRISRRKRRQ
jgi:hypothetical protein